LHRHGNFGQKRFIISRAKYHPTFKTLRGFIIGVVMILWGYVWASREATKGFNHPLAIATLKICVAGFVLLIYFSGFGAARNISTNLGKSPADGIIAGLYSWLNVGDAFGRFMYINRNTPLGLATTEFKALMHNPKPSEPDLPNSPQTPTRPPD